MADPDEALIEAIRAAVREQALDRFLSEALTPEARDWVAGFAARAAYAAMVAHLRLVEEWGVRFERDGDPQMNNASGVVTVEQKVANEVTARAAVKNGAPISAKNRRVVRRLVSRWTEVDHGSE